jgi:uncharacterized phage protein (TIGR02216 family)
MSFGLGVLRLSPREFWAMTPRELDAAIRGLLGPPAASPTPSRAGLDQLMQRFPDARLSAGSTSTSDITTHSGVIPGFSPGTH